MLLNEIIKKQLEVKELEDGYGMLSCADYPNEYERMEQLNDEVHDLLKELDGYDYVPYSLHGLVDEVAEEIYNGNITGDIELEYYRFDDYVDVYITNDMGEYERRTFYSLFYYMSEDDRKNWVSLEHFVNHEVYYSSNTEHIIIVVDR